MKKNTIFKYCAFLAFGLALSSNLCASYDVTTVAGSAISFSGDGGISTAARLNNPFGVFVHSSGDVYFSDTANNRIRKITASTGFISTIAGTGTAGFSGDGAAATDANLNNPQSVFVDNLNNVYFADTSNNRIRMLIGTAGTYFGSSRTANFIYTIAGIGTAGSTGDSALATAARLNSPRGVFVDSLNNLYIADTTNNRIRMVVGTAGTYFGSSRTANFIYTIAGGSVTTAGFAGDGASATAAAVRLNSPRGVFVDSLNNLYIADTTNNRIRMVVGTAGTYFGSSRTANFIYTIAGGSVTTAGFAGDGASATAAAVRLNSPQGVFVDSSNNVYIADSTNNRVRMVVGTAGTYFGSSRTANFIYTIAGTGTAGFLDGSATSTAMLSAPQGVSVNSTGDVYIADGSNDRIRMLTASSNGISTIAGSALRSSAYADGVGSAARFKSPGMMSIDLSSGNLLEPDSDKNVRKITTAGGVYTASTLFNYNVGSPPVQAVCVYITSSGVSSVITTDNYSHLYQWIQSGGTYVNNSSLDAVSGPAYDGYGLVVDSSNNIFMTDSTKHIIYKIQPSGTYSVFAGTYGTSGATNGTQTGAGSNSTAGSGSTFNGISGVTIDSSGNLYVSDTGNNTIRKITSAGVVTTIAGTAGTSGFTDAAGSSARFNSPWDIDIDAAGNLYVADRGNNLIRKLTNNSGTYTVSTIAGTAGSSGSADGTGAAARFNAPTGLAVDAFGYVFVTDTGNNTIRRLAPPSMSIEIEGADSATVSAPIANDVHKTGTGTSVLSGDNSSLLNLSVDAGLVKVSATNHMGKSVSFNGGNMEVTSGTIAIPVVDTRSAATITTDSGAAVSSIAAPYGTSLLTIAGPGVVTAGNMSASATPLSIPGVMHVGASSSSKMPTGVATVPSGGLVKIMGNTASSVPGDTELESGAVLEVADSVTVPAHTGADIFGTLKFDSGASLKLGASSTWARNISVGTAL